MNIYIQQIKEISHDNKYTNWYINIITKALSRSSSKKQAKELLGYCEKHHIVPECFYIARKRKGPKGTLEGNPEHKDNYVFLTIREHFIVHLLLLKMLSSTYFLCKIAKSLYYMNSTNKHNSRSVELAKKISSEYHKLSPEQLEIVTNNFKTFRESERGIKILAEKYERQKTTMIGDGNPAFGKPSGFAGKKHSQEMINEKKAKTGENNHRTGIPAYTKKYEVTSPNNEKFIIRNLRQFCKDNGFNPSTFNNHRIKGEPYMGWFVVEIREPKAILIDPNNNKHEVYNIKQFCKDNNLYYQCIIHVLTNTKPQHKGWTGYKVNRE